MRSDEPPEGIVPFGDRALRFPLPASVDRRALRDALLGTSRILDVILTETLGAVTFAREDDRGGVTDAVRSALAPPRSVDASSRGAGTLHVVEVVYDGDDLDAIATRLSMSHEEVVALHAERDYDVAMIGFLPGFAYLRGVDERLSIARRASPRTRVPAHSVAVAAGYTAIYPFASPGGWHLLGHAVDFTPLDANGARFEVGDRVRFVRFEGPGGSQGGDVLIPPLPKSEVEREARASSRGELEGRSPSNLGGASAAGASTAASASDPATADRPSALEIADVAGPALVVDAGRPGHARSGVPPGGPMVPAALARANAAVGNRAGACAIELYGSLTVTARGKDLVVADDLTGARLLAEGASHRVATAGRARVRYLAVAGGLDVPLVLGSRCTLLVAALGGLDGRPIRRGDTIPVDRTRTEEPPSPATEPSPTDGHAIAIDLGPDVIPGALDIIRGATFRVAHASDRTGTRLDGPMLPVDGRIDRPSAPMVRGAIQLTTGGLVVLGPDHPTTGGYPVIGVVRTHAQGAFFSLPLGSSVRLSG